MRERQRERERMRVEDRTAFNGNSTEDFSTDVHVIRTVKRYINANIHPQAYTHTH